MDCVIIQHTDDIYILEVSGEASLYQCRYIVDYGEIIINDYNCNNIIIDCRFIERIDSSILGAIINLLNIIKKLKGNCVLVSNEVVNKAITLVKLNMFLKSFDSIDEAANYINSK